jgi:hypothetical protein
MTRQHLINTRAAQAALVTAQQEAQPERHLIVEDIDDFNTLVTTELRVPAKYLSGERS